MRICFWNTNKNADINSDIVDIAHENDTDFIDFASRFCIKEMKALKSGSSRIEPERYYVIK